MFISLLMLTTGGMLFVLALCPIRLIAWRFVRLVAVLTFAMPAFVVAWGCYQQTWTDGRIAIAALSATSAAALASFGMMVVCPLIQSKSKRAADTVAVISLIGGLAAVIAGWSWQLHFELTPPHVGLAAISFATISYLLSALLIGSVTLSWLLGHRYLTAPEMTIEPLKRATKLLLLTMGARWALLILMLVLMGVWSFGASPGGSPLAEAAANWLMISIRVGIGLLIPSVFALMAWSCVKLRSTQSATGILFFTSILVIIGELTAQHLATSWGYAI